jgi:hypothetical protein
MSRDIFFCLKFTGTRKKSPLEQKEVIEQLRLDLISKGWHGEFLYANEDDTINEIRDKCKQLLGDMTNNGSLHYV